MRRIRTNRAALGLAALAAVATLALTSCDADSAARPASGPGSNARCITTAAATKAQTGSSSDGTQVTYWTPAKLAGGTKAPVVVFLHGFMLTDPGAYQPMIDHLTCQGLIVIFPSINKDLFNITSDTDQNKMLARAVSSTNVAVGKLGAKADLSRVYLYGHSLGGLLGAAWTGAGGIAPKGIVLANPSTDASVGMPDFVKGLVTITPINLGSYTPAVTAPIVILTGDGDTIAPSNQSTNLWNAVYNSSSRSVFQARTDKHGVPNLSADHLAPIQSSGLIPNVILAAFAGGAASNDALDWRFYASALDQMIDGKPVPTFAMGNWADGTARLAPVRLR